MKKAKRQFASMVALALALLLVMAGCSSQSPVNSSTAAANNTSTATEAPPAINDGPLSKYDPPITMEWINLTVKSDEDLAKFKTVTGETFEDNRWTRGYLNDLGIKVTYSWWSNNPDQFNQKLKLAMTSGDLPDYFQLPILGATTSGGLVDLRQLAEAGVLEDMTAHWEKYVSPLTRQVVEADGLNIYNAVNVNGKMMAIPGPRASLDSYNYMFIKTDWLNKLGLQPPKSMDDLLNISKAFTHNDPDGNGQADSIGMIIDKTLWSAGLEAFFWGYHAYPDTWVKDQSGNLAYGAVQPEMLQALKALNAMYNDGQIDKEFGVKDVTKAMEVLAAGKAGIMFGGHWMPFYSLPNHQNDPNADWGCYMIPGVDGKPAVGETELGLCQVYVAKKGAKNPEAIVKLLNYHFEKLHGVTGDYDYWQNSKDMEGGGVGFLSVTPCYHPFINVIPFRDLQKIEAGTLKPEDLKGVSKNYYNNIRDSDPNTSWPWVKMMDPRYKDSAMNVIDQVLIQNLVFVDNFVGAPPPTMIDKWATLTDLTDTTLLKIIMGKAEEVESSFDAFVTSWRASGGDQITVEVNDWYKANAK